MLETAVGRCSCHKKPVTGAGDHSWCRRARTEIGAHSNCRKPETDAVDHSCCKNPVTVIEECNYHRSPDTGTEWRNFPGPGPGPLRDILHKCSQAEELEQARRLKPDIPHNEFLCNTLEHTLHSRSEEAVELARRKPETGMEPGIEHRKPESGREPGTLSPWSWAGISPG